MVGVSCVGGMIAPFAAIDLAQPPIFVKWQVGPHGCQPLVRLKSCFQACLPVKKSLPADGR
jgi:hypothetical protein